MATDAGRGKKRYPLPALLSEHRKDLLGHKHVNTTMIYTHVIRKKPYEIGSPLDSL